MGQAVYIYKYVCVIGTLCEPLFVQFASGSWIPVFSRILKERRSTSGTNQRRPLRGCNLTIAYLYINIFVPQVTLVRHNVQGRSVGEKTQRAHSSRQPAN